MALLSLSLVIFFFFKQKTAYEMRISDWSSDVCSSDLAKAHYLDITGEISVFEHAQTQDARAKAAGIVVCPGVGFDVIPTDCVAAALKAALPDATHLALGFDSRSGFSPGTAKTSVEGLAQGGKVRENGPLRSEEHTSEPQ